MAAFFRYWGSPRNWGGHAAPLGFLVGTVVALLAGYSYVRLALTYQRDGASYTYLKEGFPHWPVVYGIAGWTIVIGYVGTLALYAYTFGAYGSHLLGHPGESAYRLALSGGVLTLFVVINVKGARTMGRVEDLVVYVKIVLLAILAGAGMRQLQPAHFQPFFNRGFDAMLLSGAVTFVAFEGFQLITNGINETKEPERNLPRGVFGSILITGVLYIAIAIVAIGALGADHVKEAGEYALAMVARPVLGAIGVVLVDIAALLATSSAINATLFGAARLASAVADDDLAPKALAARNRKASPSHAVLVIGVGAAVLTVSNGLETIVSFSSLTFLLVSLGVSAANWKRRQQTKSSPTVIGMGIALMAASCILLIWHQWTADRDALHLSVGLYVGTIAAFFAFRWWWRNTA